MTRPKRTPDGKAPEVSAPVARFDVPEFMVPKSIAEVRELARLIALAEWAPDSYRDLDGNYVQQKIELAIMHGATVGLGPIAAVQSIAVIDGMPTIWGDGALSIVERSGLLEDMLEEYRSDPEEGLAAICTMRRRRRPTPIQNRFSMAMAEQAQLTRKEGPWQSYPQRMLKMRARSWSIRDGFADVLRGLHIREEVDDFIETGGLWPQLLAAAQEGTRGGLFPNDAARPRRTPPEPKSPAVQEAEAQAPAVAEAANAAEPGPAQEESFSLADAEGGFIDVTDAEALRAEFERLFWDKALSPNQILGLWESNAQAREAIERLFGPEALEAATERVRSAEAGQEAQLRHRGASWAPGDGANLKHPISSPIDKTGPTRTEPEDKPAEDRDSQPAGARPRRNGDAESVPVRARQRGAKQASAADPKLVVTIDPSWGDQKVFGYYRARLAGLHTDGVARAAEIAQIRAANCAIEARLRRKLPHRMEEIDFLYGARTGSGDGESGVSK